MEKVKTQGFSAKDEFNAASATPLKDAKNSVIKVSDVMIKENAEGQAVAYFKTNDGTIFATVSATVVEQSLALIDLVPAEILVNANTSKQGREYLILELQ